MKAFTTICLLLALMVLQTQALWDEIKQCRDVKKKRRGYRAGFADPKKLLESNRFWTGDDLARGSIESRDDLPEIEMYEPTAFTYRQRQKTELQFYKADDGAVWDQFYENVTEITREHYDFYIVDPDNGEYVMKNQSYLIIFGVKDDEESLYWGKEMGELHCELNRKGIIPLFSDILLEPIISHTFGRKYTPQLFMIWNETQKVYAFDYSVSKYESINWILNGSFVNSTYQFPVSRILPWQLYRMSVFKDQMVAQYFKLIGNYILKYINVYVPKQFLTKQPFKYFIDTDGSDIFHVKFMRQFYLFIAVVLIVSFTNLQIFRRLCCKKVIIIRKKKRVDKDTQQ